MGKCTSVHINMSNLLTMILFIFHVSCWIWVRDSGIRCLNGNELRTCLPAGLHRAARHMHVRVVSHDKRALNSRAYIDLFSRAAATDRRSVSTCPENDVPYCSSQDENTSAHMLTRWSSAGDSHVFIAFLFLLMGRFLHSTHNARARFKSSVREAVCVWFDTDAYLVVFRVRPRSSSEVLVAVLSLCLIQFRLNSYLMCTRCAHKRLSYSPWRGWCSDWSRSSAATLAR